MSGNVPYQAYRSKRHSRHLSIPNNNSPISIEQPHARALQDTAPSPVHPISSAISTSPSSQRTQVFPPPRTDSLRATNITPSLSSKEELSYEELTNEAETVSGNVALITPQDTSTFNGHTAVLPSPSSTEIDDISIELPRQRTRTMSSSKFRHVPFRSVHSSQSSSPLKPSPLAATFIAADSATILTPPSLLTVPRTNIDGSTASPQHPAENVTSDERTTTAPSSSAVFREHISPSSKHERERAISDPHPPHINGSQRSELASTYQPDEIGQRVGSPNSSLSPKSQLRPAPYRPGFQPPGVYRDRTDEYLAARQNVKDEGKVERQRLDRRLEKLVDLHFGEKKPKPPLNRRSSSLFDMEFTGKSASTLWRGVLESGLSGHGVVEELRNAEQAITPWQNDQDIKNCPICGSTFHPLTNRKHHCRTCGRVICSLPVKMPVRDRPCSILFVVDANTGQIEEVEEGVDYGVKRRPSTSGNPKPDDKFLKGVRICQDCRPVLLRKQYQLEMRIPPKFAQLHQLLVALEDKISLALASFEDLIQSRSEGAISQDAIDTRKELLQDFSDYEVLVNRIRSLLSASGPGSSQDRIQRSIANRANLFLQKNMLPLKVNYILYDNVLSNETNHRLYPNKSNAKALRPGMPRMSQFRIPTLSLRISSNHF